MMKDFLRAASASIPVHLGDVEKNEREILNVMEQLAAQHVQLALFPELCLTGATLGDLFYRQETLEAAWAALQRIAQKSGRMIAVVGLPVLQDGGLRDAAVVVQNGTVQAVICKPVPSREQRRWFGAGQENRLLDVDGTLISFWTENEAADLIVLPDASPAVSGSYQRLQNRLACLPACLYANAGTGESTGDHVYDGYAAIWEDGRVLRQNRRFECGTAIADIDTGMLRFRRLSEGRSSAAETLVHLSTDEAPLPLMRPLSRLPFIPDEAEGLEEIAAIQTSGFTSARHPLHAAGCWRIRRTGQHAGAADCRAYV